MTINKQKLFKFYDLWPWALVLGIFTGPSIKAITYNNGHLPVGAWISIICALIAVWGISIFRFLLRKKWIDSIFLYTDHGIGVFGTKDNLPITFEADLDQATEEVTKFWNGKQVNGNTISISDCLNAINGSTLGLSSTPIILESSGDIPPSYKSKLVRGYDLGSQMNLYLDLKDYKETIKVFKHELGHLCLDTIGISDEDASHKAMADNGFIY